MMFGLRFQILPWLGEKLNSQKRGWKKTSPVIWMRPSREIILSPEVLNNDLF